MATTIELRGPGGEPVDFRRVLASHGVATLPPNRIDEQLWTLERGEVRVSESSPGYASVEPAAAARRPRTNGKVERFHQTMAREWAYGLRYRSSRHRAAALPHWLRYYNQRRPHSSLRGLPPISRVHNVRGQDN